MNMDSSEPAEALDINFTTTDGEQMFDLLDGLRAATWSIAEAITPADPPDRDENGQAINSLSQEVANVSSALRDVAGALHAIAAAIEAHGRSNADTLSVLLASDVDGTLWKDRRSNGTRPIDGRRSR